MVTVKIFHNEEQIEELQIMMVGGGLQGLEGPTGYDYVLIKPKHPDMPHIAHKPEDGDIVLAAKALVTLVNVSTKPVDNIIQFPIKEEEDGKD